MKRVYYGYNEFLQDAKTLVRQMDSYKPDAIVAVSRGGMTLGHLLSECFGTRNLFTINAVLYDGATKLEKLQIFNVPDLGSNKEILIVDEIADSGETLTTITEILQAKYPDIAIKTATLFQKHTARFKPDFFVREATQWIDFFWSVDLLLDE